MKPVRQKRKLKIAKSPPKTRGALYMFAELDALVEDVARSSGGDGGGLSWNRTANELIERGLDTLSGDE